MNQREKLLAAATGGVLVLIVLYYAYGVMSSAYKTRQTAIRKLKEDIGGRERKMKVAKREVKRLHTYREMSLPEDEETAKSLYKSWLLEKLIKVGMSKDNISVASRQRSKSAHELSFRVSSEGNLQQLTRLLYEFYSANVLHRISVLQVQPKQDSKDLKIGLVIEALALAKSDNTEKLNEEPAGRLARANEADYLNVILGRNLFFPANQPPKITSSGRQTSSPNVPFSFEVKAKDADSGDQISYAIVGEPPAGAKLDPKSGRFSWTSKEKGEFEVTVAATDSGFPAKTDKQVIKLVVADPPPPAEPTKKKLEFDEAKYTKISGITSVDGRWEVWLSVRTKGETLKLHVGDKINVGSIQGVVKNIEPRSAEIDLGGKMLVVTLDDFLVASDKDK